MRTTITGPKGENIACKLYQQTNGDYIGEFTPVTIGQYRIDILFSNQPVSGSPYYANAYDPQGVEIKSIPKELIFESENYIEGIIVIIFN